MLGRSSFHFNSILIHCGFEACIRLSPCLSRVGVVSVKLHFICEFNSTKDSRLFPDAFVSFCSNTASIRDGSNCNLANQGLYTSAS